MGITTYTQEFKSHVAPEKLFKGLITDSHNIVPKIMPDVFKSSEFVHGDGGVGSVKLTKFHEGRSPIKFLKHKMDELDENNRSCKITLIEGDVLDGNVESVVTETKVEACDGGSVCKMTTHIHTKGDYALNEEKIKEGKEKTTGVFKAVEGYLMANPNIYG